MYVDIYIYIVLYLCFAICNDLQADYFNTVNVVWI